MTEPLSHVVVVGGGPTGATVALAAAQQGFRVTLIERDSTISSAPRASTIHPSTLEILGELGIVDEVISAGLIARYFDFWDKSRKSLIARFDHQNLANDTQYPFVVQTEQHKLVAIALNRLREMPGVEVRRGAAVTGVSQDQFSATAHLENADGSRDSVRGDFLVGCDGGRSTVRRELSIDFEGFTWPERFLVLTSTFDFESALSCSYRTYLADPDEWANLFKVAGDDGLGRWRVVFPAGVDQTDDEASSDAEVERRLRGLSPDLQVSDIVHRNIYSVHQRVAASFRVGRVLLAGDAAHVNNPIGGLGLNCGVHDAFELVEALDSVRSTGDHAALDHYAERRRAVNVEFVQEQTVKNKRRLEENDEAARQANQKALYEASSSPALQRQFLMRTSLLASRRKPESELV